MKSGHTTEGCLSKAKEKIVSHRLNSLLDPPQHWAANGCLPNAAWQVMKGYHDGSGPEQNCSHRAQILPLTLLLPTGRPQARPTLAYSAKPSHLDRHQPLSFLSPALFTSGLGPSLSKCFLAP